MKWPKEIRDEIKRLEIVLKDESKPDEERFDASAAIASLQWVLGEKPLAPSQALIQLGGII